jgi:TerB N-terminal domain/TerB-C domain
MRKVKHSDGVYIQSSWGGREFLKQSYEYRNKRGNSGSIFAEFFEYYPSFSSFDKKQKDWYFYFREQAVNGVFEETTLSYLYVFIYELINYGFNQNAAFNISMLVRLHDHYIEEFPKLDRYLPNWIGHMLIEANEPELAEKWVRHFDFDRKEKQLKEELISKNDWSKVSVTLWKEYIQTGNLTTFYTTHKTTIYNAFKMGIQLLNEYEKKQESNLIDKWFHNSTKSYETTMFNGAIICRDNQLYEQKAPIIVVTQRMKKEITALMKIAENAVRAEKGNKSKVKVEKGIIPTPVEEEIYQMVLEKKVNSRFKSVQKRTVQSGSKIPKQPIEVTEPEENTAEIVFDDAYIKKINLEGEAFQEQFERFEEVGEPRILTNDQQPKKSESLPSNHLELFKENETQKTSDFLNQLDKIETSLLASFEKDGQSFLKAKQLMKDQGAMINVVLDSINNKAYEYLQDVLIEQEGDHLVIVEEFVELLALVKPYTEEVVTVPKEENQTPLNFEDFLNTRDEGQPEEFLDLLDEKEKTLLLKFENGSLLEQDAKQFMKSKGAMVNVVISSINDKSNDIFGENFIEQDDEQLWISEEYKEIINLVKETVR